MLIALASRPMWAQASVDESLENTEIYVNGETGSDTNPGTVAQPLKTISAAASLAEANNHNGVATRVIILPGTYRESVSLLSAAQDTTAPMTFEAQTNGTAIVSGADVWTGWQAAAGNPAVFMQSWPYSWGLCASGALEPSEPEIAHRREMIFVNGQPLTQVLALGQMQPGTFYVDETASMVYIQPASGTNLSAATVEVAVRPSLFELQGKTNVVLRGLTFEYANSCQSSAAVYVTGYKGAGNNILLDDDSFLWNNAQGVNIAQIDDVTVTGAVARHNGEAGLGAYQVKNSLWQSNDSSFNNWRGAQAASYAWNAAGAHFMLMHNQTVSGLTSNLNQSHGIHWDTDNANVTATGVAASQNLLDGALVEKSEGPTMLADSAICGQAALPFATGLALRNSSSVTLSGDTFVDSGTSQIQIIGQAGGIAVTNWETSQTEQLYTEGLTMTGNTITAGGNADGFADSYLGGADWTPFASSLVSDYNTWTSASSSAFVVPVPAHGSKLNLAGWQSLTRQDLHSQAVSAESLSGQDQHSEAVAAEALPSACQVTSDSPDYWLLANVGSATLTPGQHTSYKISVVPFGFSGQIGLSADGVTEISGLSSSWSTTSLNSSGSATFTISASSSTSPGTYPITVIATGGGLTRTVTVWLTVN
jgi:hypothetical protein